MKKKKIKPVKIKRDFSANDLPHNRFQVFFDVIKVRWDLLLYIGLVFLVFFIPIIVLLFSENVMSSNLYSLFSNGELTEETYRANLFQLHLIFTLIEVVLIVVLFVPISGIIRLYRLITFYEGVIFFFDLFKGIKDNYGQTLFVFSLDALFFGISKILIHYLFDSGSGGFMNTVIFFLPLFLLVLIIIPLSIIHLLQIAIYDNKLSVNIKNSMYLYLKSGLTSLPISLLLIAPLFLMFIKAFYTPIILLALYALVWLPFLLLIVFLHGNWTFDKNINKDSYPSIYDKGIYRK